MSEHGDLSILELRASTRTSGYPSPAQDHGEARLDVRDLLIRHPAATFFLRTAADAKTDALREAGIAAGDILVVDRALHPWPGALVVAVVDGELVVRSYRRAERVTVWGVVSFAIHPIIPLP